MHNKHMVLCTVWCCSGRKAVGILPDSYLRAALSRRHVQLDGDYNRTATLLPFNLLLPLKKSRVFINKRTKGCQDKQTKWSVYGGVVADAMHYSTPADNCYKQSFLVAVPGMRVLFVTPHVKRN